AAARALHQEFRGALAVVIADAEDLPFRAHPAHGRVVRRATVDLADQQAAVADVADEEAVLAVAEEVARALELPRSRVEPADNGVLRRAADILARDDGAIGRTRAVRVPEQEVGAAVVEEAANPLELPFRPERADLGVLRRAADDRAHKQRTKTGA